MKYQFQRIFTLLMLACLALSLSSCGQKGGLTRPEQTAFAVSYNAPATELLNK